MIINNVLKENKRLKAIRRKNKKEKTHNFITKTLPKPDPIFIYDSEQIKQEKKTIYKKNYERIKERRKNDQI